MAFFEAMSVSATALTANRLRMDTIAENIANVNTTRTAEGGPFQRKMVLFQEIQESPATAVFRNTFGDREAREANRGMGVRVTQIVRDQTPGALVYDPAHPDSDALGYVRMPNINIVTEMVNMISASRAYEANITAINTSKALMARTLEIARN